MSSFILLIVWVIAITFLVIVIALATPWRMHVNWNSNRAPAVSIKAQLLGGLLPAFSLSDSVGEQKPKRARKTKSKPTTRKRIFQTRTIAAGVNLIPKLLNRLHLKRAVIIAEFGFDDPAETGQVYGALVPIMYSVNSPAGFKLIAEPQFDQRCLNGEAEVQINVTPISLAIPILGFVWQAFGPKR